MKNEFEYTKRLFETAGILYNVYGNTIRIKLATSNYCWLEFNDAGKLVGKGSVK